MINEQEIEQSISNIFKELELLVIGDKELETEKTILFDSEQTAKEVCLILAFSEVEFQVIGCNSVIFKSFSERRISITRLRGGEYCFEGETCEIGSVSSIVLKKYWEGEKFFGSQNLEGADFSRTKLVGADFSGTNLTGAKFEYADLRQSMFNKSCCNGVDFSNCLLEKSDFCSCILANANLNQADLSKANLTNADLAGTCIRETNFSFAILTEDHVKNANFNSAILIGTDLSGATITRRAITRSETDEETILPNGKFATGWEKFKQMLWF